MSIETDVLSYRLYREFRHHILYPISSTKTFSPHIYSAFYFGNILLPCRITVLLTLTHGSASLFAEGEYLYVIDQ